jgi:hypothetical protein
MEVMKQTAVEWLRDLYENRPAYEECILEDEWEEALKMEKEQMIDAWSNGWLNDYQSDEDVKNSAEQYYNEIFNTNEK